MNVKRPSKKYAPAEHLGWDPSAAPTFWINHASRQIMRRFEQDLRPLGFGMAYVHVLGALEEGPQQQKEHAHVEQPTMAALLTRMERDGLIAREPHPTDKRASLITLTARAKSRLPAARERLRDGADAALSGLSEREQATLLALLQRIAKNLADPAA
jgi:DNA-binding MarR family transcriptional regulator